MNENKEKETVIINGSPPPKISMPIDPDILSKYKWDSLEKIKEFHKKYEDEMAIDDVNSGNRLI